MAYFQVRAVSFRECSTMSYKSSMLSATTWRAPWFVGWVFATRYWDPSKSVGPPSKSSKNMKKSVVFFFCTIETRWWFRNIFYFHWWGRFPFWRSYFSDGLVQPSTRKWFTVFLYGFRVDGTPKSLQETIIKTDINSRTEVLNGGI